MKRDYTLLLKDIREAIDRIEAYTRDMTFEALSKNSLVVDAVIANLIRIGEAVKKLPEDIQERFPEIPWRQMARLRDFLVHHYWKTDEEILWKILTEDLPQLKLQLSKILPQESDDA